MKLLESKNITIDSSPTCFAFRHLWTMAKQAEPDGAFRVYVAGPPKNVVFRVEFDPRDGFERHQFRESCEALIEEWENALGIGIFPVAVSKLMTDVSIQVALQPVSGK